MSTLDRKIGLLSARKVSYTVNGDELMLVMPTMDTIKHIDVSEHTVFQLIALLDVYNV